MSSSKRGVSRRTVLAGAVGAAVGVGGSEIGAALQAPSAGVGPHVASPGEALMVEHGVLKRVLLAYRAMVERLNGSRPLPGGLVADASQIISDYVESFHEGLEEGYVFPRVADHEPELIRTLLIQHDRGRHLTADIQNLATSGLDIARNRAALAARMTAFVRMYEPHEAWEDTVVYPTLRRAVPQRTLDELGERFAELENRRYGDDALSAILERVSGIEHQLGIGDLAAFTPREVS